MEPPLSRKRYSLIKVKVKYDLEVRWPRGQKRPKVKNGVKRWGQIWSKWGQKRSKGVKKGFKWGEKGSKRVSNGVKKGSNRVKNGFKWGQKGQKWGQTMGSNMFFYEK